MTVNEVLLELLKLIDKSFAFDYRSVIQSEITAQFEKHKANLTTEVDPAVISLLDEIKRKAVQAPPVSEAPEVSETSEEQPVDSQEEPEEGEE